ncbi:PP2C family protein-serine/threonine phosphatase [Rubrobacter calidifluminis]|uniref:PP2C family protein-serine/threonine phosphatase n=1 Tax=Rubrobacter calidifluminis TaxID=1392640 RepID=UPI002362D945|nr:SpoIIE family protein phosphatase [Rubrobacter calidifluminis]
MRPTFSEDRRGGGKPSGDEMRRLLDRAVAASSNGIVITDARREDNPIIYVNPAFERTTGYSFEEVCGRNCRFLQNGDRNQPQLEELRKAIREGGECRVVLRNYRKDGEQFWNELYISPVFDEEGRLTNFIGVQNDITERKRAEEERDLLLAREQLARAEAVSARKRLSLLASAGAMLSSSLEYAETLHTITRILVPELADWCLVDVEENGVVRQAAEAHADQRLEALLHALRNGRDLEGTAREVWDDLPRLYSGEEPGDDLKGLPDELRPRCCIRVPLLARGRMLGAMTLAATRQGFSYDEEDLALAEDLAYRCALAMDNARLYGEQNYIAQTLQQSLLPRLPEPGGIDVGAEYLPAGEGNEVGGDFYDLIECGGRDCWISLIGDVCGHGAVAAATNALARYTVRAVALLEVSPAKILSDLNEAMLRQLSGRQFCTAACIRVALPATGGLELSVTRAGHPAPFVVRGGGGVERVGEPGRALGVFDDPELVEEPARLEPGDAIVLYTDGVTEARSPDGAFFGEERLCSLLGSCAGLGAAEVARVVKAAVLGHAAGNPHDDIAVLVLRAPEKTR